MGVFTKLLYNRLLGQVISIERLGTPHLDKCPITNAFLDSGYGLEA